jgi:hypothetical protein
MATLGVACGGQTGGVGSGGDGGTGSSSGTASSSGGGSSGSGSGSSSGGGSSSGSGSSSGGGSSSGSSGTGPGSPCPTSPDPGGACSPDGLQCEYGTNPNPECNQDETCMNGAWSFPTPGVACPTGTCPATYPGGGARVSCSTPGVDCAYSQGQCNCDLAPLENPSDGTSWQCFAPGAGCPEPRGPLGSTCTQEGLTCDYGSCTGGISEECSGGIWVEAATACPG